MREKGLWKKLLSVLFVLGMAVVLLPGMSMTVNATTSSLVGTIVKVGGTITIDDRVWVEWAPGATTGDLEGTWTLDRIIPVENEGKTVAYIFCIIDEKDTETQIVVLSGEKNVAGFKVSGGEGTQDKPYTFGVYCEEKPTPAPSSDNSPASEPKREQDQTLVTGFITNGNDANGNPTYAYFSQENVWSVTKVSSNANSITYDITPQWETYGIVSIGIPAPGFADGPVQVDHYKNGKLIATYNGWVTSEWCTFDNPDGYSTFVIRKPGTNAQNAKRAYVPNTGVE